MGPNEKLLILKRAARIERERIDPPFDNGIDHTASKIAINDRREAARQIAQELAHFDDREAAAAALLSEE